MSPENKSTQETPKEHDAKRVVKLKKIKFHIFLHKNSAEHRYDPRIVFIVSQMTRK